MRALKKLNYEKVSGYVDSIFTNNMHKKRQLSLSDAAFGLMNSKSVHLHHMGAGLAKGKQLVKKHATKQIDRLLSNKKFDIWQLADYWIPHIIGSRKEITIALDWTSFANDLHETICINLLTSHGRATPLLWQTVDKTRLKNNRARHEDQLLTRLKEALPDSVKVTLIADRGFASYRFFEFLDATLGFDYIIRIKASTLITNAQGTAKKSNAWLSETGRATKLITPKITKQLYNIASFVAVKDTKMKQAWFLVSNKPDNAKTIINLYAKRWKIEPYFRDIKDQRFGYGLYATHISKPERKDRLLFIIALAYVLLTLLGAAGEGIGFDKHLKVNTVKTRTHSLIRQGMYYYDYFENFSTEEKNLLMQTFNELLCSQPVWNNIFEVI